MTVQHESNSHAAYELHAATLREDPLYLDRCQVDTPDALVDLAWRQVNLRRKTNAKVVDFGAGDARFARSDLFDSYIGYEVDAARFADASLSSRVQLINRCAFSHTSSDADLCIGNPPYVRNQDLPTGWRQMAAVEVRRRTGVSLSGLANAWQYFLMLAISSVKSDGLVVQILPYEWVSRPAAASMRNWIEEAKWNVDVYRLPDGVFGDVLTAASITVIDKRATDGKWCFFDLQKNGSYESLPSPTQNVEGVVPYSRTPTHGPRAKRGLSPGTQKVLTLTEGERIHLGLHIRADVVRCVTSLRLLPTSIEELSTEVFNTYYRDAGLKCWLIRTDTVPSVRLQSYLESVDSADYQTATCLNRTDWWRFTMPIGRPQILLAQAFKGSVPKVVRNVAKVVPVGGVAGIYDVPQDLIGRILSKLSSSNVQQRLVPYAKQMNKLEINQLNTLLADILHGDDEQPYD